MFVLEQCATNACRSRYLSEAISGLWIRSVIASFRFAKRCWRRERPPIYSFHIPYKVHNTIIYIRLLTHTIQPHTLKSSIIGGLIGGLLHP